MTTVLRNARTSLGWFSSLGGKFFRVVPLTSLAIQTIALAAQVLLLLAFFLPLKVVILLGSASVPGYFPSYLRLFERDKLIVLVSVAALSCYVLYVLFEVAIAMLSRYGTRKLLDRSRKIRLFENQEKIAAGAYSRYVRAMASAAFMFIAFAILLYIYSLLFFIAGLYAAFVFLALMHFCEKSARVRGYLAENLGVALNSLAAVGFMVTFFCMVANFLLGSHPGVFAAVISLLLIRQGFQRAIGLISDIAALHAQRRQIGALFFHSQPLISEDRFQGSREQALISIAQRQVWIGKLLRDMTGVQAEDPAITWHQIGSVGVYAFEVTLAAGSEGLGVRYLIKLFAEDASSLAAHERTLLTAVASLPTLRFIGASQVEGLHCHLFVWSGERKLIRRQIGPAVLDLASRLMAIEIPNELLMRFMRSRQFLEQRISGEMLERVRIAVTTSEQARQLDSFVAQFARVREQLAALPRQLTSLDFTDDTLLLSPDDKYLLSHWSNWRVEPLGAGWPVGERDKLGEFVQRAAAMRPELLQAAPAPIMLAALMYAFERFCNQRNYQAALGLVVEMLPLLDEQGVTRGYESA
ncbi:hypothetical protein A6723_009205 [Pseudomonas sp. AU11447]|uniref:hypothetical protein n=1 Tax=unclassified Pseudomonas TaxID=196821 RepID=UPI0007EC95EB|nr:MULTISPECIES: hypothetical protein [unclassified Pseudomonas]OBY93324.1 hypothetical protein A6723_009205 [Pseudomonas sp. AU11447]